MAVWVHTKRRQSHVTGTMFHSCREGERARVHIPDLTKPPPPPPQDPWARSTCSWARKEEQQAHRWLKWGQACFTPGFL